MMKKPTKQQVYYKHGGEFYPSGAVPNPPVTDKNEWAVGDLRPSPDPNDKAMIDELGRRIDPSNRRVIHPPPRNYVYGHKFSHDHFLDCNLD